MCKCMCMYMHAYVYVCIHVAIWQDIQVQTMIHHAALSARIPEGSRGIE